MQTFEIPVVRTASQFLTITVEAKSLKEAEKKALDEAGDHEFPGEKSSDYKLENDSTFERELVNTIATPFFTKEARTAVGRLERAKKDGFGPKRASELVEVSAPYTLLTVDQLLTHISATALYVRKLVNRHY